MLKIFKSKPNNYQKLINSSIEELTPYQEFKQFIASLEFNKSDIAQISDTFDEKNIIIIFNSFDHILKQKYPETRKEIYLSYQKKHPQYISEIKELENKMKNLYKEGILAKKEDDSYIRQKIKTHEKNLAEKRSLAIFDKFDQEKIMEEIKKAVKCYRNHQ